MRAPLNPCGRLAYNVADYRDKSAGIIADLTRPEIEPTLGPDGAPIRNPYRKVMSIAYGLFSTVERFVTRNEVESVLRERRLLSGGPFPFA